MRLYKTDAELLKHFVFLRSWKGVFFIWLCSRS